MYKTLTNITLAEIREVLGENGKKVGNNFVFQCPVCRDNSHDNLIYEGKGKFLHCFSCANNEGGKWVLSRVNKLKEKEQEREVVQSFEQPKFLNKKLQDKYLQYMDICNQDLIKNSEMLDLLYEKRGIDKQTVIDCGLGFDDTEDWWVIPIFSLKYPCIIMGFEFRCKEFDLFSNGSKVKRTSGYISDISPVWGKDKNKTLFLLEGFMDSYCMRQYLRNKGFPDDYTIYSCSNGVSSLLNVLNRINFANFNQVKMILDTDEAGTENTLKIIEQYPFIQDKRKFLFDSKVKDFNEWYIKKGR